MGLMDYIATKAGWVVVGRLRSSGVRREALNTLKRELRDWDMRKESWIDREWESVKREITEGGTCNGEGK